jgi:hypothetical protein
VILILLMLACCAGLLWAGSHTGLGNTWIYTSGVSASEIAALRRGSGWPTGTRGFDEILDSATRRSKDLGEQLARRGWEFGIEVRPARLDVHVYTASSPSGGAPVPSDVSFAGFRYIRQPLSALAAMLSGSSLGPTRLAAPSLPGGSVIGTEQVIVVPFWALVVLFALWPVLALFRGPWRRAVRCAAGRCRHCGYDLTGLTEPRCPECGGDFARILSTVRRDGVSDCVHQGDCQPADFGD